MIPLRRPAIVSTIRGGLLALTFPATGTFSASANLGIVWANPADHTELLSPLKGFNFTSGFGYIALNLLSVKTQTLFPTILVEFYIVDSSGADLYLCGSSATYSNAGVNLFNAFNFSVLANSTPGSGIRGHVTISGTATVEIPAPVYFFGSM